MNDAEEAAASQAALEALPDDATAEQIVQATAGCHEVPLTAALRRLATGGGSLPEPSDGETGDTVRINDAGDAYEIAPGITIDSDGNVSLKPVPPDTSIGIDISDANDVVVASLSYAGGGPA